MARSLNQSHYSVPGIFFQTPQGGLVANPMPPGSQTNLNEDGATNSVSSNAAAAGNVAAPPSEQLYESASIIYGPVGYLDGGGKTKWFLNNGGTGSTGNGERTYIFLSFLCVSRVS